uniref:Uracil-DNA glycosylase-like domain-containing protein n=1 Tax=viral metagenome TaxID=1070528 RepID=A0A6C0JB58_9ZZZZ
MPELHVNFIKQGETNHEIIEKIHENYKFVINIIHTENLNKKYEELKSEFKLVFCETLDLTDDYSNPENFFKFFFNQDYLHWMDLFLYCKNELHDISSTLCLSENTDKNNIIPSLPSEVPKMFNYKLENIKVIFVGVEPNAQHWCSPQVLSKICKATKIDSTEPDIERFKLWEKQGCWFINYSWTADKRKLDEHYRLYESITQKVLTYILTKQDVIIVMLGKSIKCRLNKIIKKFPNKLFLETEHPAITRIQDVKYKFEEIFKEINNNLFKKNIPIIDF